MAAAHVQSTGIQSSGSVASVAKAFTSSVTAGNTVIAGCVGNKGTGANNMAAGCVSNNVDGAMTDAVRVEDPGANTTTNGIFYKHNSGGGSITVTFDQITADFHSLAIIEASGLENAAPEATNSGAGTGTTPATGNLVTTVAGLIVGVLSHGSGTSTLSVGTNFNQAFEDEDATDMPINCEYRVTPSSGTYTASWTSASVVWACVGAAFKEAAAGGTTRGAPFGARGTAFNGGRTFWGIIRRLIGGPRHA